MNSNNILVGKPKWKTPLGSPRSKWKDNLISKLILEK
jgi:hypothetical protein